MYAGMAFGLAEVFAQTTTGFLCKYFKDTQVYTGACLLMMISQMIFFFVCGGQTGSLLSVICIFTMMIGIGAMYCVSYLMVELRVSADKLGSAMNLVFTVAPFLGCFAVNIAYTAQPVPFLTIMALLGSSLTMYQVLPAPIHSKKDSEVAVE